MLFHITDVNNCIKTQSTKKLMALKIQGKNPHESNTLKKYNESIEINGGRIKPNIHYDLF